MMLLLGIKAMTLLGIKDITWNKTLLLRRKAMTNLESILKSRDTTLPTKIRLVKARIFPVVRYGWESWTINKAECQRIDAFELWCWRRLLRVPWTARRSNQSTLKEYSLKGLMLKLQIQYFGLLMRRTDSFEKTLMVGKIEGRRRRGQQRMRCLDGITNSMDIFEQAPGAGDGQGSLACCSLWGHKELDMTEWLNNGNNSVWQDYSKFLYWIMRLLNVYSDFHYD